MKAFLARYWFPTALVALLLLALPGVLLFALNLFGLEKPVNTWLIDSFHLSYHLPIPWWGILILLLVPFAIVILYFLKLKRRPLSVPTTFLWKKSIEDLHVNSLFQWLRQNVLLLLQVLAVLLLIYGVMAFHLHGRTTTGKHYILLIDNSASMAAVDVTPSRLEQAKDEALRMIDSATDEDFGMVIEFNDRAEIKQSYTTNRGLLRQAVKSVRQTQRLTRIEEALSLADSLANPLRSTENAAVAPEAEAGKIEKLYVAPEGIQTEVHLFSDGRFPDLPESALTNLNSRLGGIDSPLGNLDLHYHAIGNMTLETPRPSTPAAKVDPVLKGTVESTDNVAVVTFSARREETSRPGELGKLQVFLRAVNFRDKELKTDVDIDVYQNGRLRDSLPRQPLFMPARKTVEEKVGEETIARDTPGEGAASFELPEADANANLVLHARLSRVGDKFPLDDQAWLVVGVSRKARVLIVGPGNEILKAFFDDDATREVAEVGSIEPRELKDEKYLKAARNGTYDLVIFDRCAPADERDLPRSNTFFIGHPPPPWKLDGPKDDPAVKVIQKLDNPHIKDWNTKHPLLRYLSALHSIGLSEAFSMDVPPRNRLIEGGNNTSLMVALNRGPFTDLVMTFPLVNDKDEWTTNWPLLPSFPLFLRNVLFTMGNITDAATEDKLQPGQVKTLRPDAEVRGGVITDPDKHETTLKRKEGDLRTDFVFGGTDLLGPYQVRWDDGGDRAFAVNLLDLEESNIEPRSSVQIGSVTLASGRESSQPREVWKWFALLALLVLLVEWYIYNRRVYV